LSASTEAILLAWGVLPLQLSPGESFSSLGLKGDERFDIDDLSDTIKSGKLIRIVATSADQTKKEFSLQLRLDTQVEKDYYANGGILQTVLRNFLT
jgi:aconitate hydratase